jgi:imidazolonepropionase-like amidohydrolase
MRLLPLIAVLSAAALAWLLLELVPTPAARAPRADADTTDAFTDAARFVIRARVFDGERLWPRADVQVADGRIEAIAESLATPDGYALIDATGRTLLPGLIDAHVHTWGEARRDALRFGVTTILDMFSDHRQLAAAREQRASLARTDAADLWSAGTLATVPGGHGTEYGMNVPTLTTPAEADAWVAARQREGSDWIKLVREDLRTYSASRRMPNLDDATAKALIDAAHARGLKGLAHVSTREHAFVSLRDGADGLVHVFEDEVADEALLQLARERGAFVIPTLSVVAGMSGEPSGLVQDARVGTWLTPSQRQTLAARFDFDAQRPALIATARENVRRLHAAGVVVLAGTDAPNPNTAHGVSMHDELAQLVQAGLTPVEALTAATARAADAFALADRGRIAAGRRADLLLVDGDPGADIRATRAIAAIWKNGRLVAREVAQAAPASAWRAGPLGDFGSSAGPDSGWIATTDEMIDGHSRVALARGDGGALRIEGEIAPGAPWPWAGAMFSPGAASMQAVDASGLTELRLRVRGDGREYALLLFSGAQMGVPAMQPFLAGPEWSEVRVPLNAFAGADLSQVRAVAVTAGLPPGRFALQIDAPVVR